MPDWLLVVCIVIVLLVIRDALAWLFGWGMDENGERIDTRDPEGGTFGKMINWHKREVRGTYIGWRPTDAQGGDTLTPDPGNFRRGKNGDECDTPSGKPEYYHVIRKGRK